jgi:hypothetical protein
MRRVFHFAGCCWMSGVKWGSPQERDQLIEETFRSRPREKRDPEREFNQRQIARHCNCPCHNHGEVVFC